MQCAYDTRREIPYFLSSPGICHELNNVFAACMQNETLRLERVPSVGTRKWSAGPFIHQYVSMHQCINRREDGVFFCLFVRCELTFCRRLARDMPLVAIITPHGGHILSFLLPGLGARRGFRFCSLWCIHDVNTNSYGIPRALCLGLEVVSRRNLF